MIVISLILIFTTMVLSSLAVVYYPSGNDCTNTGSYTYDIYAAVLSGITIVIMGIALFLFYNEDYSSNNNGPTSQFKFAE
jgi:H+/gluconate symporter-like permease